MTTRPIHTAACAAAATLLTLAGAAPDAAAQGKPTLTRAEYGRFENLGRTLLSPDGRWMAYAIARVDDTTELRVRPLDRDTTRTIRWGSAARFSPDSRWLAWSVGVSPTEQKRLEKEKKPLRLRAGVLDLNTLAERTFDGVRTHAFDASGRFLALHGYAPEEPRGRGADLRVLDLASGTELTIGNVGEFAWSGAGSLLAVTIATGTTGGAVQVYDARTGRLQSLDASTSAYRRLAWRKKATDLAVLRSVAPALPPAPAAAAGAPGAPGAPLPQSGRQLLLAWRGLELPTPVRFQLDSVAPGLPDTLQISEHFTPQWSDDGRRISLGLRPVVKDSVRRDSTRTDSARTGSSPTKRVADEDLPTMQIWHTSDVYIVPQQQAQRAQRAQRTLLAVWEPATRRVVQVGSDLAESASLTEGARYGIEHVAARYPWGTKFGREYRDTWVIDLATGARTRVLDSVRYSWPSDGGRYLLSFDGRDYWSYELGSGTRRNITRGVATAFADTASDLPSDLLPPHGVGGWLDGDRAVLLYDKHDIWRVAPDGSGATRLTRGAEERVTHRVVNLDPERRTIDPNTPLYLSLHGTWSGQRGYARLHAGRVERLILLDKGVSRLAKADSAAVYAYTVEARDDSPDYFVAGPDLAGGRQVTRTNPFLDRYAWTRSTLLEYRTETGRPLQGILLYPAGYDPSKRYPMIVYAYEILTPQLHNFEAPTEKNYYNTTAWTQQGYFVLLPDIVFRARDPGVSLLETLRPAVAAAVARGLVDAKRVGFAGHSWGGYEATYVATHSNIFAASVAGAPLTDFVSFMGQIHWTPGMPEVTHWETGQARMQVPYWEDPAAHHRNSPIHNVQNMTTPLLMAFGNEDGVVDWDQGTEFYNFARRAGKQMVLLVYEGENHSFRKPANQIDYHRRILEWFGHYLKGEPAQPWMTRGVPLDEMEREKRRVATP